MALKILIIEDNLSFLVELRMKLEDLDVDINAEQTEGGALIAIVEKRPDLVLLDLHLGDFKSGPILAQKLYEMNIPFVVVTGSKDEGIFDEITQFQPLAYYTKPIDIISLRYVISKITDGTNDLLTASERTKNHMFVKWKSEIIKLSYHEILFIQGEGNYITLHTSSQKKFVVRKSLKQVFIELSKDVFIRIHRNFIINKYNISSYNTNENTVVIGETTIPVGRSYKAHFKKNLPL